MATDSATDQVPPRSAPRRRAAAAAAAAGVLAAGAMFGVAHAVAAVVDPPSSPFSSLGDTFIDLTPEWLKEFAISLFGTNDKTALLVGMVLVIVLLAATTGMLSLRRPGTAQGVVLALGLVAGLAAVSRPQTGQLAIVPSLVGAAVGAFALGRMVAPIRTWLPPDPAPPQTGADLAARGASRRAFLGAVAATGAVAMLAAATGALLSGAKSTAAAVRALVLPKPAKPAPPVPADAQSPVAGVVDVVTPNSDFYRIDTAFSVPQVDPASWRLRVHGLVDHEVTLTFDDLLVGRPGGGLRHAHLRLERDRRRTSPATRSGWVFRSVRSWRWRVRTRTPTWCCRRAWTASPLPRRCRPSPTVATPCSPSG